MANDRNRRPARKLGKRRIFRKKVCRFCKSGNIRIDYKDVDAVRGYITIRGKIVSAKVTGNCARHQRQLSTAIKRLRNLALLPYTTATYKRQ
ncbi:30S ribosomal protein S18 [bacterium]